MKAEKNSGRPILFRAAIAIFLAAIGAVAPLRAASDGTTTFAADNPAIHYDGRAEGLGTAKVTFGWSGARARMRFQGSTSVGVRIDDDSGKNYAMAWIDGAAGRKFQLNAADGFYELADGLDAGEHTVEIVRVTECNFGLTHFRGFVLEKDSKPLPWQPAHVRRIEFIGDSITCGYGVEVDDPKMHFEAATENFCLGYSALAARQLDADRVVVARSGIGMVRNYDGPRDGSEDTMPQIYPYTFYLRPDIKWDFRRFVPDVVCLNLGTNDFSTTGVNVEKFVATYARFVNMLLARYPDAKIVLLEGPMNNSKELRAALDDVISRLGGDSARRVHFLELSAQGGVGLGADYHPNRAQSKINAAELSAFLARLMDWR